MAAALSEWDRRIQFLWREAQERPSRFATLRRAMEENLITSFAALINERRQRGLGIDQYIWRSSDDDRVRGLHQRYGDKIFAWDAPPEDGHPGQAFNCRCFAEPLILDAPEYVPLSDREFARAISDAELDGNRLAKAFRLFPDSGKGRNAAHQMNVVCVS